MYQKSVSNSFDLKYFNLLERLYPTGSGLLKTAPSFKSMIEINADARILYFSCGNCIIKFHDKSFAVHQNDVLFLFTDTKYSIFTDSTAMTEVWWVDIQGNGVETLTKYLNIDKKHPIISGIVNPTFFCEIKSIVNYYDNLLVADVFNIIGSLYKLCAILLDECTTSEWANVSYQNSDIIYTGNWTTWPLPNRQNQEEIYTGSPNSYAEYNFYGSGIKWFGTLNFDCGKADIMIDGIYQATVDCYSPNRLTKQLLYSNTKLVKGEHIIKIFCTGKKNDKATNFDITIDSFQCLSQSHQSLCSNKSVNSSVCKKALEIIRSNYSAELTAKKSQSNSA